MRTILCIIAAIFLFNSTAVADIYNGRDIVEFYVPEMSSKLVIPSSGWELFNERYTADGTGYYYHLISKDTSINFSVFFEKTDKCKSPSQCRDFFWSNPGPGYNNAKDVNKKTVGEFSVLQFYIDNPPQLPGVQSNISAHHYRDGYWIDIHMSKSSRAPADYDAMYSVLNSLRFGIYSRENDLARSFTLQNHGVFNLSLPSGWQVKYQQQQKDLPPTVIIHNRLSRLLITPIWGPKGKSVDNSDDQLRRLLESTGKEMLLSSVEKNLAISKVQGQHIKGYYFTLTDRAPKSGEFKYGTISALSLNDLIITATYLSNDQDLSDFRSIVGSFSEAH